MRKVMQIATALAGTAMLGGCYESQSDLIGSNAVTVSRLDSIIVFNYEAYYAAAVGKQVQLCNLKTKADLARCDAGPTIKMERTSSGNYIVQAFTGKKYYYGLWTRSDPGIAKKGLSACLMWLGDGIVGSSATNGMSLTALRFGGTKVYQSINQELQDLPASTLSTRDQLKHVVEVYERYAANTVTDEFVCLGERAIADPTSVVIAGDNRHLPAFTSDK